MVLPTIPAEASYANWLANCMQRYFEARGFTFYNEIQSQRREKNYPFDIYAHISKGNLVKRLGLQVKRPSATISGIYWDLDSNQHTQMQNFPWIYYSLPDFLVRNCYRVACYHTLFKDSNFPFVSRLHKSKIGFYYRLGSFANRLIDCPIGQIVTKGFDWMESLAIFKDFYFVNQIHTYLDFTERKGQLFTNIQIERDKLE